MSSFDSHSIASSIDEKPGVHKLGSSDGPTALRDPENVKKIFVVAFGAFDRYYICWEDSNGQHQQESHKLPPRLEKWLFPPSGRTRDFPTLQVSLGHNDEFVAFDQFGKISSRDAPQSRNSDPLAAAVAAAIAPLSARKKSHTVASTSMPENLLTRLDEKSEATKLERRRSIIFGGAAGRRSWAEKRAMVIPKESIRTQSLDRMVMRSGYVDAGVQTEVIEEEDERPWFDHYGRPIGLTRANSMPVIQACHPPPHAVPIGSMQDLCRMQYYRLGDALQQV